MRALCLLLAAAALAVAGGAYWATGADAKPRPQWVPACEAMLVQNGHVLVYLFGSGPKGASPFLVEIADGQILGAQPVKKLPCPHAAKTASPVAA